MFTCIIQSSISKPGFILWLLIAPRHPKKERPLDRAIERPWQRPPPPPEPRRALLPPPPRPPRSPSPARPAGDGLPMARWPTAACSSSPSRPPPPRPGREKEREWGGAQGTTTACAALARAGRRRARQDWQRSADGKRRTTGSPDTEDSGRLVGFEHCALSLAGRAVPYGVSTSTVPFPFNPAETLLLSMERNLQPLQTVVFQFYAPNPSCCQSLCQLRYP